MKSYKSQDSFKMKENMVYIVWSEPSEEEPKIGETILIDSLEKKVVKTQRMSDCVCGKCGLQNKLGIQTE